MGKLGMIALVVLAACGGDDSGGGGDGGRADGGQVAGAPVNAWLLSGTITLPVNETAPHLKLVVADDINSGPSNYANDPVALSPTGSPPVATFSVAVDTTRLTV